jgi:thiamine biosynthesis lipoprotein
MFLHGFRSDAESVCFEAMQTVAVARNAMATRFEIVLHGEDAVSLRAAGEEALDEIERIEAQLSLYQPTSEISRLNARAAREPVRVTPEVFGLLRQAQQLCCETVGAFDITVAPLVRCWGFMKGTGKLPSPETLAEARNVVGMNLVELQEDDFTVHFAREGVMLDFGAIGKGYAVERAAELLREAGIVSALVNGGTSTVYALGTPPEADCWKVALEFPTDDIPDAPRELLATVPLRDEAMSVSAVWGKSFQSGGKMLGHVLDPRSGEPAPSAMLAAVALPSATETDALSTALLVAGGAGIDQIAGLRSGMRALVAGKTEKGIDVKARGISNVR